MLRRIHNLIKHHIHERLLSSSSQRGQVGLVLILIIAIGLVFYAVTLNLGSVSQVKTLTVVAANTTAAFLGSTVASHGEAQLQQVLGGDPDRCEFSAAFLSLMKIVAIVAIVAIGIATGGFGFGAAAATTTVIGGAIAATMATTSMVLNLTVVDPAITEMINGIMTSTMSQVDRTAENGVQMGLQGVVTDEVMIPDFYDLDHDGRFHKEYFNDPTEQRGLKPLPHSGRGYTEDTVPRFSYYLYQRVRKARGGSQENIADFLEGLSLLVKGNPGAEDEDDPWKHWALWDPVKNPVGADLHTGKDLNGDGIEDVETNVLDLGIDYCARNPAHPCCQAQAPSLPSECDPCCQPMFDPIAPRSGKPGPRPNECRNRNFGGANSCSNRSIYFRNDANADNDYPYLYDPFFENVLNNDPARHDPDDANHYFVSFKEWLGRDDEHHLYKVNPDNPNYRNNLPAAKQLIEQPNKAALEEIRLVDATGVYKDPDYNPRFGDDKQEGLFPFLYKTDFWGVDLSQLEVGSSPYQHDTWCDPRANPAGWLADDIDASSSGEQNGLALPRNPGSYNGGFCVDRTNDNDNENPRLLDTVDEPAAFLYDSAPDRCLYPADFVRRDDPQNDRFSGWRPGADRYCAGFYPFPVDENLNHRIGPGEDQVRVWPYNTGCPKQGEYRHCEFVDSDGTTFDTHCRCGDPGTASPDPFANIGTSSPLGWPEDQLDEIVYEINHFLEVAANILSVGNTAFLMNNPYDWVHPVLDWIEPLCPGGWQDDQPIDPDDPDSNICDNSFTDRKREGKLHTWRRRLSNIESAIWNWMRVQAYVSPACTVPESPDASWCVPRRQNANNHYGEPECACVTPEEAETFNVTKNGQRGDLEDVIACLKWNAEDSNQYQRRPGETYAVGGVNAGNADKFRKCTQFNFCIAGACSELPRSLIPGFCEAYQNMNFPNDGARDGSNEVAAIVDFEDCMATAGSGNVAQCRAECNYQGRYAGAPYNIPNFNNNDCNAIVNNQNNPYFNAVVAAYGQAVGSCDDIQAANNPFRRDFLIPSANEAENQIVKMAARYKFLQRRLDEARKIANRPDQYLNQNGTNICPNAANPDDPRCKRGALTEAVGRLTAFLDNGTSWDNPSDRNPYFDGAEGEPPGQDSPAEKLIDALQNIKPPLPAVGIYVWQDPPLTAPRSNGWSDGYWHAAKVEVRIPERCNQECNVDGTRDELPWPGVRSRMESWDMERCYRLVYKEGLVKVRVIRYDENRDPAGMKWPNRKPIWRIMNNHPMVGGESQPMNAWVACRRNGFWLGAVDSKLRNQNLWERAFMLNQIPSSEGPEGCWNTVHREMLKFGVETESCAQYFMSDATWRANERPGQCLDCAQWDDPNPNNPNRRCVRCNRYATPVFGTYGFRVKFVPCDERFLEGEN
ncbi:MAG: hypothetical protein NUV91_04895 [Candidatus Omnitrophica bacterium]|nr:hypothetical protein [Candidatus Omnitrophota bacterium]